MGCHGGRRVLSEEEKIKLLLKTIEKCRWCGVVVDPEAAWATYLEGEVRCDICGKEITEMEECDD